MKVKMLEDHEGSEDGVTVQQFAAGEEYEVSNALGKIMLREGVVENVGRRGQKMNSGPSENK